MATSKTSKKTRRMLIDASHPEETRVVVIDEKGRIDEFDYESSQRTQLKGNIYLARVTRVEPSLQAAFVDYGGNRHGFLAFSEIHPDYYQIPVADREALLKAESAAQNADDAANGEDNGEAAASEANQEAGEAAQDSEASEADESEDTGEDVSSVGAEDALDELPLRSKAALRRRYKIQEVIRRGQVMLVQVVKEERGTKGAALTTYLSLAGRYCVLMPNTARGGGISRKITDARDRKRLKTIAEELKVPAGMGLIIRTAGAQRTRAEIKRDFNYLLRLWENIRELTLQSTAPKLVYEEGNLVKRAIRDLYTKDIAEILVEGEAAHKEARAFMKMLMPSHVRNVKLYKEDIPLFARYQVDAQLDGLFSPIAPLPSGGYLVLNQTEALVSIDINSGKSTREHSIEDTALKTNLEAAEEIARQLRLRDLAGLIVIDFIDMEDKRNIRQVERKLKESLKGDRARIQVGRISQFGLLEMSRQRLRQGMLENATRPCPHCFGTGIIRSVSSAALSVLRGIEEHLANRRKGSDNTFTLRCHPDSAFYILNEKRDHLTGLEHHFGVSIYVEPDRDIAPAAFEITTAKRNWTAPSAGSGAVRLETALAPESEENKGEATESKTATKADAAEGEETPAKKKRRRRRGKRGGRKARKRAQAKLEALQQEAGSDAATQAEAPSPYRVVDMGEMVIIVRNRTYQPASEQQAQASDAQDAADATTQATDETASQDGKSSNKTRKRRSGRRGGRGRGNAAKAPADAQAATDAPADAGQPAAEAAESAKTQDASADTTAVSRPDATPAEATTDSTAGETADAAQPSPAATDADDSADTASAGTKASREAATSGEAPGKAPGEAAAEPSRSHETAAENGSKASSEPRGEVETEAVVDTVTDGKTPDADDQPPLAARATDKTG